MADPEKEFLFAIRMRTMRERRGLTLEQLAKLSGVRYQTLYRIETKRSKAPTVYTAAKIAKALHASLDMLVGIYDEHELIAAGKVLAGELDLAGASPSPTGEDEKGV